jgi:hypothetical protein
LNSKIGGRDIDYTWQSTRTAADRAALTTLYRSGYVNEANNLNVPIIDLRSVSNSELHDTYNSFVIRKRLDRARGNHDNEIIWTAQEVSGFVVDPVQEAEAFELMDRWLAAIDTDGSSQPYDSKVVADKPGDAVDRCTVAADLQSACFAPPSGSPRMGAGEPLTDDYAKCQLKPLSRAAYLPARFTDDEWAALRAAFPAGVCDYAKPAVEWQTTVPWLTYESGPGGQPMGAGPEAKPFSGP